MRPFRARPFIAGSLLAPEVTAPLSAAGLKAARLLWDAGLHQVAHPATSVLYTMESMRGVRSPVTSGVSTW